MHCQLVVIIAALIHIGSAGGGKKTTKRSTRNQPKTPAASANVSEGGTAQPQASVQSGQTSRSSLMTPELAEIMAKRSKEIFEVYGLTERQWRFIEYHLVMDAMTGVSLKRDNETQASYFQRRLKKERGEKVDRLAIRRFANEYVEPDWKKYEEVLVKNVNNWNDSMMIRTEIFQQYGDRVSPVLIEDHMRKHKMDYARQSKLANEDDIEMENIFVKMMEKICKSDNQMYNMCITKKSLVEHICENEKSKQYYIGDFVKDQATIERFCTFLNMFLIQGDDLHIDVEPPTLTSMPLETVPSTSTREHAGTGGYSTKRTESKRHASSNGKSRIGRRNTSTRRSASPPEQQKVATDGSKNLARSPSEINKDSNDPPSKTMNMMRPNGRIVYGVQPKHVLTNIVTFMYMQNHAMILLTNFRQRERSLNEALAELLLRSQGIPTPGADNKLREWISTRMALPFPMLRFYLQFLHHIYHLIIDENEMDRGRRVIGQLGAMLVKRAHVTEVEDSLIYAARHSNLRLSNVKVYAIVLGFLTIALHQGNQKNTLAVANRVAITSVDALQRMVRVFFGRGGDTLSALLDQLKTELTSGTFDLDHTRLHVLYLQAGGASVLANRPPLASPRLADVDEYATDMYNLALQLVEDAILARRCLGGELCKVHASIDETEMRNAFRSVSDEFRKLNNSANPAGETDAQK